MQSPPPGERAMTLIVEEPREGGEPMLPLTTPRARVVETRESFHGVLHFKGRCKGEVESGATHVSVTIALDHHGPMYGEQADEFTLLLRAAHGNRFKRGRRYEFFCRDCTDDDGEEY